MASLEKTFEDLIFGNITLKEVGEELQTKEKAKLINYFINRDKVSREPLKDSELNQLNSLVGILQILYNSKVDSPISDENYDILQELLISMGIPRLSGSQEINDMKKESHKFTNLRGSLNKVYYLFPDQKRSNPSRKYLDEWIKSMNTKYERTTGKKIDLNDQKVCLQTKMDGASTILEITPGDKVTTKFTWLTRGDTGTNRASDVSHIMNIFNNIDWVDEGSFNEKDSYGIKFETMMTEENKDKINSLQSQQYKNSRQIVTATLNSVDPDFKVDYLYPVPLRIMKNDDEIEQIHPQLIRNFPTKVCRLSERDVIKKFADENKWVYKNGMRFRTDGVVITILNPDVQKALGRENNINNFEVALKTTEEYGYSKVIDVEFQCGTFGYITPVVVFHDIVLKGNTVQRATLANKERFDELNLHYGDVIKIGYDIIPNVSLDEKCTRAKGGREILFPQECPRCRSKLDLDAIEVQCRNPNCPSRLIGRILNYCNNVRIENIGQQTLEILHAVGLLDKGIRSLYKLKKKSDRMVDLDGFGMLKTKKIIAEIESKRRLADYEFFGAIGIEGISTKTFKSIFNKIKYTDFLNMINLKNFDLMMNQLLTVDGIAGKKAEMLVDYLKDTGKRIELQKLIEELSIYETYSSSPSGIGKIVFSGFRNEEFKKYLESKGYEVTDSVSSKTSYLVVKEKGSGSSKEVKAIELGVPILGIEEALDMFK